VQFVAEQPESGQVILNCTHNPLLVLVAYLVACAASFATLDMAERVAHAEEPGSQRLWRWIGATCLAGGIWAMHFISMLAFQAPIDIQYDLPVTLFSLVIALLASWLAMHTLSHPQPSLLQYLKTAIVIGLGIAGMHYVGMAAIESAATAYYEPTLFLSSIVIAIGASFAALWVAGNLREGSGLHIQMLKYLAALILGLAGWTGVRKPSPAANAARVKQLTGKREKVFNELVRLEQQKRAGQMDAGRYAEKRASLIGQLERVYRDLDAHGGQGAAA